MAMTLYQKAYAKTLSGAAQTSYYQSVYDTKSEAASTQSKWRVQKTRENGNVHAYTRKLTVLNGSPA
jgi:hypothetical protein